MKIQHLRFKNLNSLEGEWEIDFTQPEYEAEGIFVITGPTGVGKSTILDAISLALYGRTPRLKTISKTTNEIMSRQTANCSAELIFQTAKGKYLVHWSQRRAKDKVDGNLQAAKHEISDLATDTILEDKISNVKNVVEEVCGMDYERFTRSVMLAQGEFAKFLDSSQDQRSPILEQITGTAIYTELSKLVHLKKTEQDSLLKSLRDQMSGITLLEEEEVDSLQASYEISNQAHQVLKTQAKELLEAKTWLEQIDKETQLIDKIGKEIEEHQQVLDTSKLDEKVLQQALKAKKMENDYHDWIETVEALKIIDTTQKNLLIEIAESKLKLEKIVTETEHAKEQLSAVESERKELEPRLIRARSIQTQSDSLQLRLDEQKAQYQQLNKKKKTKKSSLSEQQQTIAKLQQQQKETADYISQNRHHAALEKQLVEIQQYITQLKSAALEINKTKKAVASNQVEKNHHEESLTANKTKLEDASSKLTQILTTVTKQESILADLLEKSNKKEIATELKHLQSQLKLELKIISLEQERERLVSGAPCPLCGSTDHPLSTHGLPETDVTEARIAQLTEQQELITQQEIHITDLKQNIERQNLIISQYKDKEETISTQLISAKNRLETEQKELRQLERKTNKWKSFLSQDLQPFHPEVIDYDQKNSLDELLADLLQAQQSWIIHNKSHAEIALKLTMLENQISSENQQLEELTAQLNQVIAEGKKYATQQDEYTQQLEELIGKKSVDALIADQDKKQQAAEARYLENNKHRELQSTQFNTSKTRLEETEKQHDTLAERAEKQQQTFKHQLHNQGFAGKDDFLIARREDTELERLQLSQQTLKDRSKTLDARLQDTKQRLSNEQAKELTDDSLITVTERLTENSISAEAAISKISAIREKLQHNKLLTEQIEEKITLEKTQQKECARWSRLHTLIGSSDGKKFRNFAQGLTFEIMVQHANQQLGKMSDRYQLIRDTEEQLELNVIDSYQAGEIRSTKNLSGGETFIVSLSLALGLSQMASQSIRVDSLFLDEGFGTLDEEALETALDTLSSLNQEGKIIGIISHIPSLKERIPTQLNLHQSSQGKSTITGIGAKSVS